MSREFKIGDHVEWNSEAGLIQGRVEKKVTADTTLDGRQFRTSHDDPRYLVKSDKTGALAMHKGGSLKRIKR